MQIIMSQPTFTRCVLLALALSLPGIASAQWYARGYRNPYAYGGYGGGYGGYGYGATTARGSELQGMASVIGASGQAALARSEAGINYEEARSKFIDNQLKWAKTYYERKDVYQSHADKEAEKNREVRDRYLATKPSGLPPRLGPSQLDPSTGQITWPSALEGPEYREGKNALQDLFMTRVFTSGSDDTANKIYQTARDMQYLLKTHIDDMPPYEYLAARKFLESMAFEGRYPRG